MLGGSFVDERTTTALLNGLHEPGNDQAWLDLDARCRPIMLAVARRLGLRETEAEDVVQSAMTKFVQSYRQGKYQRERGRLSAYLVTILRSRAMDHWRRNNRHEAYGAACEACEQLSDAQVTRIWFDERQNQLLRQAIDELREHGADEGMISAFELFGIRGVDIGEVTSRLGMTREEVYNAKYRITQRLRPIVARLDDLYEDL